MKCSLTRLLLIAAGLYLLSGCGTSDLEAYQEAVEETASYESGVIETDMSIDLTFNEEGLTFDEVRELSYFEEIDSRVTVTFDGDDRSMVDGYYNFGGLGFDMIFYFDGDDMLLKLPIMDKYLDIEAMDSNETALDRDVPEDAIDELIESWKAVLTEENVVSGKRAYVLTDRGQLKTTTYTISIDDEQFHVMKAALLEMLEDKQVIESFLAEDRGFVDYDITVEEVQLQLTAMVESMTLGTFEGEAYVDFDGRLVRQVFEAELIQEDTKAGDVKSMGISYECNYDQLGEAVTIEIPRVTEEDMLDLSTDGSLVDYFPEGLFD